MIIVYNSTTEIRLEKEKEMARKRNGIEIKLKLSSSLNDKVKIVPNTLFIDFLALTKMRDSMMFLNAHLVI